MIETATEITTTTIKTRRFGQCIATWIEGELVGVIYDDECKTGSEKWNNWLRSNGYLVIYYAIFDHAGQLDLTKPVIDLTVWI